MLHSSAMASHAHNSGFGIGRSSVGTGLGATASSASTAYLDTQRRRATASSHYSWFPWRCTRHGSRKFSTKTTDWAVALDRVTKEMGTLQRNAHTMAAQLAEADARIAGLNNRCTEFELHGPRAANHVGEACRSIVDRYMPRTDIVPRLQTV